MDLKEDSSKVEKFTFMSPVKGMGKSWWKINPNVAVRITKEGNWVTLQFEELRYRELLDNYPASTAGLVFEKKLPEGFRPRTPVFCKAAHFGSKACGFALETGLEIRPDGTIKTCVSYPDGLLDWSFEIHFRTVMGFGQAKCEYATNEEARDWQRIVEKQCEQIKALETALKRAESGRSEREL